MAIQRAAFVVPLVTVSLSMACLTTSQQVTANGKPLVVRTHEAHYAARWDVNDTWQKAYTEWRFDGHSQGDDEIDELDFYAIAGDEEAVALIVDSRNRNNFGYAVMWGAGAVGAALVVGGFVVGGDAASKDDNFAETPQGQLSGGLIVGGIAVLFASYFLPPMFLLSNDSVDDGFLIDRKKAAETAEAYNARLEATP